jgi:hypothetical protein
MSEGIILAFFYGPIGFFRPLGRTRTMLYLGAKLITLIHSQGRMTRRLFEVELLGCPGLRFVAGLQDTANFQLPIRPNDGVRVD